MLKEDKRMKANHQDLQAINAKKKAAKNILNAEIFERHTTQKNIDRLFGRASTKSRKTQKNNNPETDSDLNYNDSEIHFMYTYMK